MFKRFLIWLLKKFDYTSMKYTEYRDLLDRVTALTQEKESLEDDFIKQFKELSEVREVYLALKDRFNEINGTSIEEQMKINYELESKMAKIQFDMEKAEEYYKEVQSTLSKALHGDIVFGFNKGMCFPGSTSVTTNEYNEIQNNGEEDSEFKVISLSGRSVMMDEDTARLRTYPDMTSKYRYALAHLIKYNITDQIAKMLINSGVVQLVLGYNEDNTSTEVYYNIQVRKPDVQLEVKTDVK